jgi:PAS domain S-box-containing protein
VSKAKILIVEDEGITALNIKGLLENWGYENPLIALSSKDIFQVVVQYRPDLILMDINLNGDIDGIEIVKQLQTNFDIPVIYITAHCDEAIVERTKLTTYYGYIIKPFNNEELKITIDQAIYRYKLEKRLKNANKRLQIELEEKKSVQTELKKSEEKFRGIVEQSHDGITLIDKKGSIIEWNHGMEEITGLKEEHVLGKTIWNIPCELYNEEKSHKLFNHFKTDAVQFIDIKNNDLSGELFEGEISNVDGSRRVIHVRHFPIKADSNEIVASIVHDITEQKRMEKELKIAKNNLEVIVQERTKKLQIANEELKKEISERKQAEESLIDSRNYLNKIINSIADPVFVKDKQHRWVLLNDAFCKLIGYSREELLEKSDYDILSPHEASIFWDKDEEVFKTGIENVNEEEVTDSDGNVHFIVTKKTLYADNSGEKYLVAVIRDMNELKKAEKGRKIEHQRLMDIIEFLPDATFVINKDNKIIAWNRAIEKMTGLPKGEILGKGDYAYSVPFYGFKRPILIDLIFSQVNEVEHLYNHAGKEGNSLCADIFIPNMFGGKGAFVWGIASPFYDDNGNFMGAIESIRDISRSKKIEKMLKESEEKYRNLFNNANDMITLTELKDNGTLGQYMEVNDVASHRLGYTREELLKMTHKDLVAPENLFEMREPTKKLFKNGNVTFEIVYVTKDGTRIPVEINSHIFNLKGKNVILAIIRDITERKNAEKTIKESEDYYKTIFENTGTATFISEEDTTLSLVNAEFEKFCGYLKEEIEGKKSWKEFVSKDYVGKMEEYHNIRRIDPDLAPRNYESKFVDKYGNIRDILITVAMIPGTKKSLASLLDITDNKIAVDSLRESEAQLKMAMDMAKLVHWEYDIDSDVYTFDNQFYRLYGTTVDREGGSKMSSGEYAQKFLPPEESHLVMEGIAKALETDDPNFSRKVEHSIIRADGEKRFILVRSEIIKDTEGRTIKTYGVNQDITERKRAEKEIGESEQKYRTLFSSSPDYTILVGVDGKLVDVNDAGQEVTGLSKENLIDKNFTELDLLLDDEMPVHIEKVSQVLRGNTVKPYESRFIDENGKIRYVETYLKALKKDNEIFAFNVIAHDITKRKRAEKGIEKNLKKLDMLNTVIITANSSDNLQSLLKDILNLVLEFMSFEVGAIYLIDENEGVAKLEYFTEDSNDMSNSIDNIKIKEYPFSQVYIDGTSLFVDNFDEISPENLKPPNFESLAVVPIYSKGRIIGSFNLISKNRHGFTDNEKNLINSIGREIGSTISKLITEEKMKKLIAELKRSNDELRQFAYITSHDLQEPLRTIASFTQLLERRYKGKFDNDADEFMDYIVEASVRMKQMILDLLEYSRVTRVEKKCGPLKIEYMLINILNSLNFLIKENKAEITYGTLPTVIADESQIFRVFQNLIENAIKFKKEDENPKIHISAYVDEEHNEHVFSVSDNGIGIEEQYFDRIFTLFQRLHTKEEYEGTGIGLSISKRIIENHEGRMWVESEQGIGTTFYFTIRIKP